MDRWTQFTHLTNTSNKQEEPLHTGILLPKAAKKENAMVKIPPYTGTPKCPFEELYPLPSPQEGLSQSQPPPLYHPCPGSLEDKHWSHFQSCLFSPANQTSPAQPGQPGTTGKKINKHPPVPHVKTRQPERHSNPTGQCADSSQNILPALHQQFLISSFS